jgi:hypothetical protein
VLARLDLHDAKLAAEVSATMLGDLERGDSFGATYEAPQALACVARHIDALGGDARKRAVDALVTAIGDRGMLYMVTSGVRSPQRHAGGEALVAAWPQLREPERQRARDAVDAIRGGWIDLTAEDRKSIFDPLDAAMAK